MPRYVVCILLFCTLMPAAGLIAQAPECSFGGPSAIVSVANGASFDSSLSASSMVSIFGSGFAPAGTGRTAGQTDFVQGRYPGELACVAVEIGGVRAPLVFVSSGQINAQAPEGVTTGPADVRVILNPGRANEVRSSTFRASLQAFAPAFFTYGGRSIAAQHSRDSSFQPAADPAVVPGARPARPGDVLVLYGTGFGPTTPAFRAGEVPDRPAPLTNPVSITIGGVALRSEDVLYAGVVPGSISGLYQLNVRIPASIPDGDTLVVAQVGGASNSRAVIPVRQPRILRVPGDFSSIQAAVNAAAPGDTIQVGAGRYNESVEIRTSDLHLLAAVSGTQRAVVDGTGPHRYGFRVLGTTSVSVSGVEITGFVVQGFENGIFLENAVRCRIYLNEVLNSVDKVEPAVGLDANGIVLMNSHANEVVANFSRRPGHDPIQITGGSTGNLIRWNRAVESGFDHGVPWPGAWSPQNLGGCGIFITGAGNNNNLILENEVQEGHWGIRINGASSGNVITRNFSSGNKRAGIVMTGGATANLIMNNFATGNGLANITPTLAFDLFADATSTGNTWIGNLGTRNF